jgi:RNA polymerase sigma-70 factor, ECF subfamily
MAELTDQELLDLFKNEATRKGAFNQIVKKYQEQLYWHIRKIVINHDDANDILQNALVKAWNALSDFRAESKLYTWLYRIATNESLTFLKSKHQKYLISITPVEKKLSRTLEADEYFNGDEMQLKLQKAILTLPEKQRIIFNMKYFDEMKYEDMSEILDITVGGLKSSFHHAVKKVEKYLEDNPM